MIHTLKIENFAIVKEAILNFEKGFNVLTGETGAGKSMVVDAISILLGAKPREEDIRTGEQEAVLEGVFSAGSGRAIERILKEAGITCDDSAIVIKRIISKSGKNRNFINGSLTNQSLLFETGKHLVDVCAQNENRTLMNPQYHIDILDGYIRALDQRDSYEKVFLEYSGLVKSKNELERKNAQAKERADYLRFAVNEIRSLNLREGEEEELKSAKKTMQNLEKIREISFNSYGKLYSDDGSALENIKTASKHFESLRAYDDKFADYSGVLDDMAEKISDISYELKGYLDKLDYEPKSLEDIEERLDKIQRISRKYGGVQKALECAANYESDLAGLLNFAVEIEGMDKRIDETSIRLAALAEKLSKARQGKSELLNDSVDRELKNLGMEGARFKACVGSIAQDGDLNGCFRICNVVYSPKGKDRVDFYLAANVGEEPRPLAAVASLGELSRIMLALKIVFYARTGSVDSFIFDEIDTGIGGKVAEMAGKKLLELSRGKQVLCVTHLSQIASHADHHFYISKGVSHGRTVFDIKKLDDRQRKEEIARMIGGIEVTRKTKDLAAELLSKSKNADPS